MICHLLSLGCWSPRECLELLRSWKVQASWLPFPALRGSQRLFLASPGEETGRGTPVDPHTPALPGHLIPLTKLHLCVLAASLCQATFKGSPVLLRHFPGQAPGSPSSASPAATRGGKTSGIWPTAAKRGVRGSRGSSRGNEIPSLFSPHRRRANAPGSRGRRGGFGDAARQGTGINDTRILKAPARWFYCTVKTSRKVAIRLCGYLYTCIFYTSV